MHIIGIFVFCRLFHTFASSLKPREQNKNVASPGSHDPTSIRGAPQPQRTGEKSSAHGSPRRGRFSFFTRGEAFHGVFVTGARSLLSFPSKLRLLPCYCFLRQFDGHPQRATAPADRGEQQRTWTTGPTPFPGVVEAVRRAARQ
jgi:hypothetical protein